MKEYSLIVKIVGIIVAWLTSALLAYGMLKQDIAVLKAQREDDLRFISQQLQDIKDTQKSILGIVNGQYRQNNR